MNDNKKLNIRIKLAPQQPEVAPKKTGYVYHWNRIIGVSLLTLTTLAVLIYSIFNDSNQSSTTAQYTELNIKKTNPASVTESAIQKQPDSESVISPSNQKNSIPVTAKKEIVTQGQPDNEPVISSSNSNQKNNIPVTAEKEIVTQGQPDNEPVISSSNSNQKNNISITDEKETVTQSQPDSESVISSSNSNQKNNISVTAEKETVTQGQPDNEPVISSSNSNQKNNISVTDEKEVAPAKAIQTNNASAPLLTQSDTETFSKQIQPFVIAKTVKDKEPIGTINDIKLDANNIVTVYAYSKAVGLKGETLYYKWRLNGKDIAQVKVKVRSNHWRSYSRKFLQPHMQGDWSVALENSKGKMLAVNRFNY